MNYIMKIKKKISIIVSVYNEQDSLPFFYEELSSVLLDVELDKEIVFVNDGSTDDSLLFLQSLIICDKRVKIVNFSRNFGHEAAMLAGLDYCTGDMAVCMDADLQHPPHYIPVLIEKWEAGYDIVNMIREDREDGGIFRRLTSSVFYGLSNKMLNTKIEPNASDFFMMSRRVMDILKTQYRERTRFIRGFIQMIGFNRTAVRFSAPKRIAGESKYSFFKLLTLSFMAISTLSKVPLKIALWCGICSGLFSVVVAIYSLFMWIVEKPVSGYTTLVIFMSMMFCVNFIILGIVGQYIGNILDEAKQRPSYIVMDIFESETTEI